MRKCLEEIALVPPDVANHVLKLVKPVQQVEQVLLWPGDSVKSEDTDTSAPIMIQNILGHAWRQEWRGRGCELGVVRGEDRNAKPGHQ